MAKKLYVNFLWHMHQPYYREPEKNSAVMPWVRLHGIKSYYDMPKIVEYFPDIKVNFNIVPSLIEQIDEYISGKTDDFLKLSRIPPQELSNRQKKFLVDNFFQAFEERMIYPYPRYGELKNKHDVKDFSEQDLLDLQVWFNLTWFGQWFKDNDEFIKNLLQKGRNFTEKEKEELLDFQIIVLSKLKDIYRSLQQNKKAELSTSPYYHPILPLIIDSNIAKESMPEYKHPEKRFSYPDDARWHIKSAIEKHKEVFQEEPKGMWPSEGSVSNATLDLMIENGLKWTASDEDILRKSLDYWEEDSLCKPYLYKSDVGEIAVFFRNHHLSDLIGFVYQSWDTKAAVGDFLNHLRNIKNTVRSDHGLVSIIMDGENAWEYYHRNGWDFLVELYTQIMNSPDLELITLDEYLNLHPPKKELNRIHPGSWIYGNYNTWIGDPVKNRAWEEMVKVREKIEETKKEVPRNMYIAQGSDWFWWYGEPHFSVNDSLFDSLFRSNLKEAALKLELESPEVLEKSLYLEEQKELLPTGFIYPEINGKEDDYYEWEHAVAFDTRRGYGAMHRVSKVILKFFYGFDKNSLYLRWDFNERLTFNDLQLKVFLKEVERDFELKIDFQKDFGELTLESQEKILLEKGDFWGIDEIIELRLPLDYLKSTGEELKLRWELIGKEGVIEDWPYKNYLTLKKP